MDSSAAAPDQSFHVRSISLPSRPHPTAVKAEEDLQTLKAAANSLLSATDICCALRGAGHLYDSVEELLRLPSVQQTVLGSSQKRRVEEELEASVTLLDLVDSTKDLLAGMNEHVRGLRSAVRRRGGKKISQEKEQRQQFRFRKEMGKSVSKCGKALKRIDERCGSFAPLERGTDLSLVVGVLAESRDITLSVLDAVLRLLSPRWQKPKGGRWGLVLKAIWKNKVACEDAQQRKKDLSLCSSYECTMSKEIDGERMLRAQEELSRAEAAIGALEHELQSLLRRLIQCRVSFLNMLSLS